MIRYCTDIDYLLHFYTEPYFVEVQTYMNKKINPNIYSERYLRTTDIPMKDSLTYHSVEMGMSIEQIWKCVKIVNSFQTWIPTSFGETLGKFLGSKIDDPDCEVLAITERGNARDAALSIVTQALGKTVPIFCCDTENKHHIIHDLDCDECYYFEDHPVAAINAARKLGPNSQVIVPDWPWNRKIIKESYNELSNIKLETPNELINMFTAAKV